MDDEVPTLVDKLREAVRRREAAKTGRRRAELDAEAQALADRLVRTLRLRDLEQLDPTKPVGPGA